MKKVMLCFAVVLFIGGQEFYIYNLQMSGVIKNTKSCGFSSYLLLTNEGIFQVTYSSDLINLDSSETEVQNNSCFNFAMKKNEIDATQRIHYKSIQRFKSKNLNNENILFSKFGIERIANGRMNQTPDVRKLQSTLQYKYGFIKSIGNGNNFTSNFNHRNYDKFVRKNNINLISQEVHILLLQLPFVDLLKSFWLYPVFYNYFK